MLPSLKRGDIIVALNDSNTFKKGDEGHVVCGPEENPTLFDGYVVKFGKWEGYVFDDEVALKSDGKS